MNGDLLLGLDAGTSVVKAALFDCAGRELATASRPTAVYNLRAGWYEADMDEICRLPARSSANWSMEQALIALPLLG